MRFLRLAAIGAVVAVVSGQNVALAQAPAANPVVVIELQKGTVTLELYPAEAPRTVERFLSLVKKNFYNRQHFHRVEKGFVVQVGDPASRNLDRREAWGKSGSGSPIGVAEISRKLVHKKGAVGMAHAGDPAKADSQFYITLAAKKALDGKYAVFGQVTSGMDVVEKIELGDLVKRIYVK